MGAYVIGDIHGCLAELAVLVESLPLDPNDTLVFLGDYIDRGQDSREVIEFLLRFRERAAAKMVFLRGNHEDMFLSYLGLSGRHGDMFLFNGGVATLRSYGMDTDNLHDAPEGGRRIAHLFPQEHIEFFQSLERHYFIDNFLLVHAGIQPLRSWSEQDDEALLWIRHEFIANPHTLPYTVVFGHTPMRQVFFDLPHKIGLDTGLVYGNLLSCLELKEHRLFQVERGKRKVKITDVRPYFRGG